MGAMIPKVEKRKKSPKKEIPIKFLYSNMVRITKINDINQHYTFLSQIGQGSTGRVFKAISQKTSQVRAIK
jgi:ferredoxin-fold anticodon binding domain-containing protein